MALLVHFLLFLLLPLVLAFPAASRAGIIDGASNATYDYVIVGCGIAGLVVTMRLSEIRQDSVLCIEAGPL